MADPRRDVNRPDAAQPPRRHGLLYNLLWGWPWALAGMILSSLLLSLLIEYVGITFFWPGQGAGHSEAVMNTELGWLSSEFTRSLLLSAPSVTVMKWVSTAYQWLFVDSGFMAWMKQGASADKSVIQEVDTLGRWLAHNLHDYLMATVYVTVVTLVRVTILALSVPLFVMVALVAVVEGLGRRDLRRYGAAYESSFVYHHARKSIADDIVVHCSRMSDATRLKNRLSERFSEVGLVLNAGKTNIAYIDTFKRRNVATSFTFLGYDFKVRTLKNFKGELYRKCMPGASNAAMRKITETIKKWRIHRSTAESLLYFARRYNAIVRVWIEYYGKFWSRNFNYRLWSAMQSRLLKWMQSKYRLSNRKAQRKPTLVRKEYPKLFVHWYLLRASNE